MALIAAAARAAFERRLDPASPAPVAVALSGGGDSLALLLLAADWCRAQGRPLLALTVDHGLDPGSAAWTGDAGAAAQRAGAEWRALAWEGPKPAAGLPAAARAARHRLLADAARAAGASVLLTGHTRDDVLEGALMRAADAPALGRLREWSPSPAWPQGRGLFLLRPLLELRRAALRAWLVERGHAWLDDPANDDPRYARARARRLVRHGADTPDPEADTWSVDPGDIVPSKERKVGRDGRVLLDPVGMTAPVLAAALLCAAGTTRPPRGDRLARLLEALGSGPVRATLAGARIVCDGRRVEIGREPGRGGLPTLALTAGEAAVWDGRFEIVADEDGWTAAPLAGRMARLGPGERLSLQDIPAWARGVLPVLARADGTVRLPRPFGSGPAAAASLAASRLAAACGLIAREAQITDSRHGASGFVTLCSAR